MKDYQVHINDLLAALRAWLHDPTHIRPSAQVVWSGLNQDVLNGDQGGRLIAIPTLGWLMMWIQC